MTKDALLDEEVREGIQNSTQRFKGIRSAICPLLTAPIYGANAIPRRNWLALFLQRFPAQSCMWDSYFINSDRATTGFMMEKKKPTNKTKHPFAALA